MTEEQRTYEEDVSCLRYFFVPRYGIALSVAAADLNIVALAAAFVDGVVPATAGFGLSLTRCLSKKPWAIACAAAAAGCSLVVVGGGCNAVRYVNGSNGATQAD